MKFIQQPEDKQFFSFTELTFAEVKTIRDSLKLNVKNGSAQAGKIVTEIEGALETMDI